jgi:hypothetical protein
MLRAFLHSKVHVHRLKVIMLLQLLVKVEKFILSFNGVRSLI